MSQKDERAERLAAQLRQNLKRRKERARASTPASAGERQRDPSE